MKVYSRIYLVKDGAGNISAASCEDDCDIIQICGLQNKALEDIIFESDAYHLKEWCRDYGFEYKCIKKEYDFDELFNKG